MVHALPPDKYNEIERDGKCVVSDGNGRQMPMVSHEQVVDKNFTFRTSLWCAVLVIASVAGGTTRVVNLLHDIADGQRNMLVMISSNTKRLNALPVATGVDRWYGASVLQGEAIKASRNPDYKEWMLTAQDVREIQRADKERYEDLSANQ